MNISDSQFKAYVKHVLQWEGRTSKDPDDTAASCAPFSGAYHTNKGVTYCTFKSLAGGLGITPVTYDRFLKLTDSDIEKFIFQFCKEAGAQDLPTLVALAVTEAAWGSGPERAIRHLQEALNKLGNKLTVDGKNGPSTKAAANAADPQKLYAAYWTERRKFIDYLTSLDKYKKYKNGWNNRINSFLQRFPIGKIVAVAAGGIGLGLFFFWA